MSFYKGKIWTQTHAQGQSHMKMKAGIRVLSLQAEEFQRLQQTTRSYGRDMEQILSHSPQKEPNLPTSWLWTPSLQNYKTINFCCRSHPVDGTLLQQPKEASAASNHRWSLNCLLRTERERERESNQLSRFAQDRGVPKNGVFNDKIRELLGK